MSQTVSKISVVNQGGFDLKFCVDWGDLSTPYTPSYSIDQTQVIDLAIYKIDDNTDVCPKIHADGGVTKKGESVNYVSGSNNTATYVVSGGLDTFKIELQ